MLHTDSHDDANGSTNTVQMSGVNLPVGTCPSPTAALNFLILQLHWHPHRTVHFVTDGYRNIEYIDNQGYLFVTHCIPVFSCERIFVGDQTFHFV